MTDEAGRSGDHRGDDRLDSWKRIAAYLNRSVRTARRWEAEEGLPVHRHSHASQGSIYAYKSEIDAWLDGRSEDGTKSGAKGAMLAVLPLDNLSGDPDQEVFSDGLTEELISQLGRYGPAADLGVIARTSVMTYKGSRKTVEQIGRELGVDYVLEGSVRREAGRIRVTAQLIRVHRQSHVWAQNYERAPTNVLGAQRELALEICDEIGRRLGRGWSRDLARLRAEAPAVDAAAYETYLEGRYLLSRMSPDSFEKSIECFDEVVRAEPEFAPAYAAKAEALQLLSIHASVPPAELMPKALDAATRAVSLDPLSAEAHAALGLVHGSYTWDWAAADAAFQRAIELNPSLAIAHQWYSEYLAQMGRFDAAFEHVDRARELDPLSLAIGISRAHALWLARRSEELVAAMTRIIEMEPRYPMAHFFLLLGLSQSRRYGEAIDALMRAVELCPDYPDLQLSGIFLESHAGNPAPAETALRHLETMSAKQYVTRFKHAVMHVLLGRLDEALDDLEAACEERTWHMTTIAFYDVFDPLREEPRFKRLLKRMGLPDRGASRG